MPLPRRTRVLFSMTLLCVSTAALAAEPIRVVEDSLAVPAGMNAAEALAVVEDLPGLFALYQPVIPRVPGVKLELHKEILSVEAPVVVGLPVEGSVFGRPISERASVTATTQPMVCTTGVEGVQIALSFAGSSRNVERRVDAIEIEACPRKEVDGSLVIDVRGAMFEGPLPRDPALNAFEENIGARALQGAFLKQVPAVFDAVELAWLAPTVPAS